MYTRGHYIYADDIFVPAIVSFPAAAAIPSAFPPCNSSLPPDATPETPSTHSSDHAALAGSRVEVSVCG